MSLSESPASDPASEQAAAATARPSGVLWIELALFVVATGAAAALLVPGHFWGDDWTLYVRQADALLHGGVQRVIDDVTFTARNSAMREFTPEGYPWGTPALLAIPLAMFGRSIAAMKLTMALSLGVAVTAWYAMGRRWVGPSAALGGAALMMVSLPLISWTNLLASDIPYLAAVGLTALTFARVTDAGRPSVRGVIAVGAMAAVAFSFRQEGLAVLVAVVLAGATWHWRAIRSFRSSNESRTALWLRAGIRDAAAMVLTFVAITGFVRLVLPSQLLPSYSTAGPARIRPNLPFFARSVGAQFGVYDPVDARVEAFGSPPLGWLLVCVLAAAAAVGTWALVARRNPLDVLVLAIAGSHLYGALTFPFPDTRYMFVPVAITCFVIACGVDAAARRLPRPAAGRQRMLVGAAVLGLLIVNQVSPYVTAARGAATARRIDRPAFSPFEPEPQQMFAAVRDRTAADDVIAFSAARAMTYFTDRRAVQVRGADAVPLVADWFVVELTLGELSPAPAGFVETWRNDRYALLRAEEAAG